MGLRSGNLLGSLDFEFLNFLHSSLGFRIYRCKSLDHRPLSHTRNKQTSNCYLCLFGGDFRQLQSGTILS